MIVLVVLICIVLIFSITVTFMIDKHDVKAVKYDKLTDDVSVIFDYSIKDDELI